MNEFHNKIVSMSIVISILFSMAIVASTSGGVSQHNPFYCYAEDPIRQWTGLGGTHSVYEHVRGRTINANVSTCNPSKFWMGGRHASRFPFDHELPELIRVINDIHSRIITNYNQGRTSLCASDFELIKNWKFDPNITMDVHSQISPSGWNEMVAMAQRYQAAFPTILPATYSPNDYFFRSSNYDRSRYSLRAFADGLFGVDGHKQVPFEDAPEPDLYLRPYVECAFYWDMIQRVETDAFMQGPEYLQMIVEVSAKLGFHGSNVLRSSEIALLALQCKYEQTWNHTNPAPFCAAFSVANAEVIEYSLELDWYHRIGHGNREYRRLYENVMCFLLQDLLRFIQSNDVNDHKARIFNGHVNVMMILLHFDAFNGDDILTRHNFAQQTHRVWRSTNQLPMAANLIVVRYDCSDGDNDILFLYNEKPLQIDGCDSNGVCKQSMILERFSRYVNANCLEIYCTNS